MERLLHHVAKYADIDTRRALGVYGSVVIPPLRLQPPTLWRYWPAQKKAIFFRADPKNYEFEVHEGLIFDGEHWTYDEEHSMVRAMWKNKRGQYVFTENGLQPLGIRFSFAENPLFISDELPVP
jgi:hypothetical protein